MFIIFNFFFFFKFGYFLYVIVVIGIDYISYWGGNSDEFLKFLIDWFDFYGVFYGSLI